MYLGLFNDFAKRILPGEILNINYGETLTIGSNKTMRMYENSEIRINRGTLIFEENSFAQMGENAKISVYNEGTLISNGNSSLKPISYNYQWNGITCNQGSNVTLRYTKIENANLGVYSYQPNLFSISNSNFIGCTTGIDLYQTPNFTVENNEFLGTGSSIGIRVRNSNGTIASNFINKFDTGIYISNSSPIVKLNSIQENDRYGVFVTGTSSFPTFVRRYPAHGANNHIFYNGTYDRDSQIKLSSFGSVYLKYGYNNIFSRPRTAPKALVITNPSANLLEVDLNYWGADRATIAQNEPAYFNYPDGFTLDYTPAASIPYPSQVVHSSPSTEGQTLRTALVAEEENRIDDAVQNYKQLITKYPDSDEGYVALTKLPSLSSSGFKAITNLDKYYEKLLSDKGWSDKWIISEMIIKINILDGKFDEAMKLSQELESIGRNYTEKLHAKIYYLTAKFYSDNGVKSDSKELNNQLEKYHKLLIEYNSSPLSTKSNENGIIDEVNLLSTYPNPFNPTTTLDYTLVEDMEIEILVYNINGELVKTLDKGRKNEGNYTILFDGSSLSSGLYYSKIISKGKIIATNKMILLK